MDKLSIVRPGALGDAIMLLNYAAALRQDHDVTYYSAPGIHATLAPFIEANQIVNFRPDTEFDITKTDHTIWPIGYPIQEGYPYFKMKKHLLEYFADELGVPFTFDGLSLLAPKPDAILKRPYITIQTKTGWSVYKEWWGWSVLVSRLKTVCPGLHIYQIGGSDDPTVPGIDGSLAGQTFERNLAAQAWAQQHIGLDSVFNHTTNIVWEYAGGWRVPSVILFGSTQASASGYPHNVNLSLDLPCQPCFRENPAIAGFPLGPCINPPNQNYDKPKHACMAGITPEMVLEHIIK